MIKNVSNRGFTLIELLVVVAIIGILATIVLSSLGQARSRAQGSAIKADLKSFQTSTELAFLEDGNYESICDPGADTANIFSQAFERTEKATEDYICSSSSNRILYSNNGVLTVGGKPPTPGKWAASMKLPGTDTYFCVDYSGKAVVTDEMTVYYTNNGTGTDDVDC